MEGLIENYKKWLRGFSATQFEDVVNCYIRYVWGIKDFSNCDGTNDGGNDLKFFVDNLRLKIQVQVTVQEKNIEQKILEDVEKALNNFKKYKYEARLYFFYSYPMSEAKIKELEQTAFVKYNIQLNIFDAKHIAQEADKHIELRTCIHKQYGIPNSEEQTFTNDSDKAIYDLITFGSSSLEIKSQILKSFLSHYLLEVGQSTIEEIIEAFNKRFGNVIDNLYYNKLISKLSTDKIILKDKETKKYKLSETETERVNKVKEEFVFQEQKLHYDLKSLLTQSNADGLTEKVIGILLKLFEESFEFDYHEIIEDADENILEKNERILKSLFTEIHKITTDKNVTRQIIREIFNICTQNDILQKLSAGKMYSKFINSDLLDAYIRQQERFVYLDTQIALYAICLYFQDSKYPNLNFVTVKDLITTSTSNNQISLKISHLYLFEISYHFKEALLLLPYDENGLLDELGGTSNVFYNYFSYLKNAELLDEGINDFRDFLLALGYEEFMALDVDFFNMSASILSEILSEMNIDVDYLPHYDKAPAFEIFKTLQAINKSRNEVTISNDAIMLLHLFNKDAHPIEPIFCTWDSQFFEARKKYNAKYKGSRLWHLFTPGKLVNHLSLLKFNINSESLTRDILSSIDETFNLHQKSQKLLDAIVKLVDLKSETGRQYISKIKELKREYVFSVEEKDENEIGPQMAYLPIEQLIVALTKHYTFHSNKYTVENLKKVFQNGQYFEEVISYFKKELDYILLNRDFSVTYTKDMDLLIEKAK